MANFLLSTPNTRKLTFEAHNSIVSVGSSRMQGWRPSMEDVAVVILDIPGDYTRTGYFGVFDGHGGPMVASFVADNLLRYIMNQPEWNTDLSKAIKKGFLAIDEVMKNSSTILCEMSGTTAVTVFIRDNVLYCGNVGDSRAIAYEARRVTPLSFDHKPTVPSEYRRIITAGGFVENERINGSLALSRALGDYQYKVQGVLPEYQIVSPVPEIVIRRIDKAWEFVVLASDGIWEVMSSQMVAEFVRQKLGERMALNLICEALLTRCLWQQCSGLTVGFDNMTVIIIKFVWARY